MRKFFSSPAFPNTRAIIFLMVVICLASGAMYICTSKCNSIYSSGIMYSLLRHGMSVLSSSWIWSCTTGSISAVCEGCMHTDGGNFASCIYCMLICHFYGTYQSVSDTWTQKGYHQFFLHDSQDLMSLSALLRNRQVVKYESCCKYTP